MHPLERLVNLVALLLESPRPLTFDQVRDAMPEGYGQGEVATAKRMFERDKDVLRDTGIPIEVVSTDVWDVEQGYTISKDEYYLPEIGFTPEEISALFVAAHTGDDDPSAEQAVRKLLYGADGGLLEGVAPAPLAAEAGSVDRRVTAAAEAITERRALRFTYRTSRGQESHRLVDPWGLVFRGSHWYLVGLDRERGEVRSFRLSRVAGELEDAGGAEAPPEGFHADVAAPAAPKPEVKLFGKNAPASHAGVEAAADAIFELAVPFRNLGVATDDPVHFFVELIQKGQAVERVPSEGAIETAAPSPDYELIMWQA